MNRIVGVCVLLCLAAFRPSLAQVPDSAELVHQWNRCVIEVIMEDGFGPPIAARIHAYANLAGYQAAYHGFPGYKSLVGTLQGFTSCPEPEQSNVYDWRVAMVAAYQSACQKLLYRITISDSLAEVHFAALSAVVPKDVFDRSKQFGVDVGKSVIAYAKGDGYARTQGMPEWEWPKCDSCWEPTPPNFAKPLSPYCGMVRTIAIKAMNQFPVPPRINFSKEPGSEFYKAAKETYDIVRTLTPEQREIANFWNDNPVVTSYRGHFIYNTRQITPGGHWMNVAMQVMRDQKSPMIKALEVYSMLGFGLFDSFTSCWAGKHGSPLIRPVTYINRYMDSSWEPLLQTPPFPEHASGHSTITAAAAEILSFQLGEVAFTDSTELPFGFTVRSFKNFRQAANEASLSRLYGGIHYRRGCDAGAAQGAQIGQYIVATVKYR